MGLVPELGPRQLELSEPLDVHLPVRIDQDVRNLLVHEEGGDGPEVEGVVQEVLDQPLLIPAGELDVGFGEELPAQRLHLLAALRLVHVLHAREIELRDEIVMEPALELRQLVLRAAVPFDGREFLRASGCGHRGASQAISEAHRGAILPKRPRRAPATAAGASRPINLPASVMRSRAAGVSGSSRQRGRPEFTDVKIR